MTPRLVLQAWFTRDDLPGAGLRRLARRDDPDWVEDWWDWSADRYGLLPADEPWWVRRVSALVTWVADWQYTWSLRSWRRSGG